MKCFCRGTAVVEFALSVPIVLSLMMLFAGISSVVLQQVQLEDLAFLTAELASRSDALDSASLEQLARAFVRRRSSLVRFVKLDRHAVQEELPTSAARAPAIEIVRVELTRRAAVFPSLELRAHARAARVR